MLFNTQADIKNAILRPRTVKRLVHIGRILLLFGCLTGCNGQTKTEISTQQNPHPNKVIGGGCDGCELMFEGMPANISSVDTSAGWREKGRNY